jgi:hypothetical protein
MTLGMVASRLLRGKYKGIRTVIVSPFKIVTLRQWIFEVREERKIKIGYTNAVNRWQKHFPNEFSIYLDDAEILLIPPVESRGGDRRSSKFRSESILKKRAEEKRKR